MCGIIGITANSHLDSVYVKPFELIEVSALNEDMDIVGIENRLSKLSKLSTDLLSFNNVYEYFTDKNAIAYLKKVVFNLNSFAKIIQDNPSSIYSEFHEKWASSAILMQDISWRIEHDFISNLNKIFDLSARKEGISREEFFLFWQINTVLNGIDRLEVRGRDSAGVALQIHIPKLSTFSELIESSSLYEPLLERLSKIDGVNSTIRIQKNPHLEYELCIIFFYKIANEVGEMGENVAFLRSAITSDSILHLVLSIKDSYLTPLGHTRWASNGVISEQNCHPLDNVYDESFHSKYENKTINSINDLLSNRSNYYSVVALNGDIDNYQSLKDDWQKQTNRTISPNITTDAKIIPINIDYHLSKGKSFEDAFYASVKEFQGSMAIGVMNSLEPGRIYLALRGSGQSLYVGYTAQGFICASELYGLIEETSTFIKLDGEKERIHGNLETLGQIAILDSRLGCKNSDFKNSDPKRGTSNLSISYYDGYNIPDISPLKRIAEITTRDINKSGYEHFMLKEIHESVLSIQKTLRGKYKIDNGIVKFTFTKELFGHEFERSLKERKIKRIIFIGQGTASIASNGIAALFSHSLSQSGLRIDSMKATELSGFNIVDNMEDTIVIAVSQSGTTTDTNRTVDIVKSKGAKIISIVNRRNSDLVYKSDSVFYTSDGRDIEMSVASTKAFYSQIVAGVLMSLAIADMLNLRTKQEIYSDILELEKLPEIMKDVLSKKEDIEKLAEEYAPRYRYWAVVGNGFNYVASQELRIKFSELCYKAIACDFTEDKKHIDLSSEPLIIVCATFLNKTTRDDIVKEVAIFKAHKAKPIVITNYGESTLLSPYADGIIEVPKAGILSFLPCVMAGHLWGYYAAKSIDAQAGKLKKIRSQIVSLYDNLNSDSSDLTWDTLTQNVRSALMTEVRQIERGILNGRLNSGLNAAVSAKLLLMLQAITGKIALDDVAFEVGDSDQPLTRASQVYSVFIQSLTDAIHELTRPIDAIKHQAKTVTVGISRQDLPSGIIFEELRRLNIPFEYVLPSHIEALKSISKLVYKINGNVVYNIFDKSGDVSASTTIVVDKKGGVAENMKSRLEVASPLLGTKRLIASERKIFAGYGTTDSKSIIMFPLLVSGNLSGLLLVHVEFFETASIEDRKSAVRRYRNRYEFLQDVVTEWNMPWRDELLMNIPVGMLFESPPELFMKFIIK